MMPAETQKKIEAFYNNGGKGKPVYLQYALSYSKDKRMAEEGAFDQWRSNILPREKLAGLRTVKDFDKAGENTSMEEVLQSIPVYTDMQAVQKKIIELAGTGAERIILHNVNRHHMEFIQDYSAVSKAMQKRY